MFNANIRFQDTIKQMLLLGLALLVAVGTFQGCSGDKGPAGPKGDQGKKGPAGPEGPKGDKGTANVIYSGWIKPDKWNKGTYYSDEVRYFDISENAITQDILDNGAVNVYVDFGSSGPPIYQLPVGKKAVPGLANSYYFKLKPQNLRIGYWDPDNPSTDPGTVTKNPYRYVIIPGGVQTKGKAKSNLKSMSYQEVKERYNIPD